MDYGKRPPLDEQKSLWEASLAREGVTTGAGAAAGDSFIDAGLAGAGANSFVSMLAILYPGDPQNVDSKDITGFDNGTGEVTLAGAYKGVAAAIPAGVPYKIVTFRFVPAEVAAIKVVVDAILVDTSTTLEDKLDTIDGIVDDILADTATIVWGDITGIVADLGVFPTANYATLAAYVEDIRTRLVAILADVTGIAGAAMRGTDGAALATAWTAALATALASYTAARAVYLDQLDFNLQEAIALQATVAKQNRILCSMDFWSDTQEELLINATAADKALPNVAVAELPDGATIVRAIAMFKFRMVENVFDGANAINVAQHIQVRDSTPGVWRDAISIADNLFNFASKAREGGDILIGDHDIAVEVDEDATYNFQWEAADADQISINFNDIQCGIRIWYSV